MAVDGSRLVSSVEWKMDVARVGDVFKEELNMDITMEAPVEGSLIFLDFSSVSGPPHACWNCEPRAKKKSSTLSLSLFKVCKTGHCHKEPQRSLGEILLANYKAELWSPGGEVESEKLYWCRCEKCGWDVIQRKAYPKPVQFNKEARIVVIDYSHEVNNV